MSSSLQYYIETPTPNDILCGKDKAYSKHYGNLKFRDKIHEMVQSYRNAQNSKPQRMQLTKQIVEEMEQTYHARFLRPVTISVPVTPPDPLLPQQPPPIVRSGKRGRKNPSATGAPSTTSTTIVWEEITNQQARDKTSHALRFALNKIEMEESSQQKPIKQQQQKPIKQQQQQRSLQKRRSISVPTTRESKVQNEKKQAKKNLFKPRQQQQQQRQLRSSSSNFTKNHETTRTATITPTTSNCTNKNNNTGVTTTFFVAGSRGNVKDHAFFSPSTTLAMETDTQGLRSVPTRITRSSSAAMYPLLNRDSVHETSVSFDLKKETDRCPKKIHKPMAQHEQKQQQENRDNDNHDDNKSCLSSLFSLDHQDTSFLEFIDRNTTNPINNLSIMRDELNDLIISTEDLSDWNHHQQQDHHDHHRNHHGSNDPNNQLF